MPPGSLAGAALTFRRARNPFLYPWRSRMKVSDILRNKGTRVVFIGPDLPLVQALDTMISNKVGALPVKDGAGDIVGIITERDLMRAVHENAALESESVSDRMTTDIVSGHLDESVEEVMETMTERRFRHMPVLQDGKLVGIISIGDLVKSQLRHYERQVSELTDYVAGKRRVSERPPRQRRSGPPLFPSTVYRLPDQFAVRRPLPPASFHAKPQTQPTATADCRPVLMSTVYCLPAVAAQQRRRVHHLQPYRYRSAPRPTSRSNL